MHSHYNFEISILYSEYCIMFCKYFDIQVGNPLDLARPKTRTGSTIRIFICIPLFLCPTQVIPFVYIFKKETPSATKCRIYKGFHSNCVFFALPRKRTIFFCISCEKVILLDHLFIQVLEIMKTSEF